VTVVAIVLATATRATAQTTSPPGPWVVDVRGVTSPVPIDPAFYPPLDSAFVPARGFGVDAGAHVYVFNFGPARVGFGANLVMLRGTASPPPPTVEDGGSTAVQRLTVSMRMIAPQVSLNFGSHDGWSYLSAGLGAASMNAEATDVLPGRHESGLLRSVNYGGGARWFLTERLAFGFDLRAHQIAAGADTPKVSVFAVAAGLSIR
jgi:hypothetical protein